jgi:hypothetical protein
MEETFSVQSVPELHVYNDRVRVAVVRSEKLAAEAGDTSGTLEERGTSAFESRYQATANAD